MTGQAVTAAPGTAAAGMQEGLAPVRDALLAAARVDADRVVATGAAAAAETRAAARRGAAAVRRRARAEGEAAAEQLLVVERARDRRQAHRVILEARRQAWDELHRAAVAAAERLASEPGYPELTARLSAAARDRLGDTAVVAVDGPEGAGVVARAGNRRLDLRLALLAERALPELGPRLEELWR